MANCHGCKHLDEVRSEPEGTGYCCVAERSKAGRELNQYIRAHQEEFALGRNPVPSIKVRRPDMERCELFAPGSFANRFDSQENKKVIKS